MELLSVEQRTVVELTYFHGLHYREIAEIMDCPENTVKSRMFYARERLRTELGKVAQARQGSGDSRAEAKDD